MDNKHHELLEQLTLEEKASLCSGLSFWTTKQIERLGIPSVMMTDGPNGLRKEKLSAGTNIMKDSEPATCFPPSSTLANTWDPSLAEEVGNAIADEAKALGVTTVLGPGVNIKRSPVCGRNFEYFSEDPLLAGEMGASFVHGVQKNGIGVSLKHFLANNQEYIRMSIDSIVDERALREIYMPAFEKVVKKEHPSTVMCSYNRLNGTYLSDSKKYLTDVLRDEWGFDGIVVSDWGATNNRVEGIKAGMDLEMPGNGGMNDIHIVKAVKNGELKEEELDRVVLRMIDFAFKCKENEVKEHKADLEGHHQLARKVAGNGTILMKNENGILPLSKNDKIAVVGKLASKLRYQGSGSSHIHPTKIVSFVDELKNQNIDFEYADGYTLKGDGYSKSLIAKAKKIAQNKDKVLVFIGLTDQYESEGFDRTHINLPEAHNILVEKLLEVNPNIIVVLSNGSPVKISKFANKVPAIVDTYLGGQAGGSATFDVLYGQINPCGKLAESFPLRYHDNIVSRYFPMGPRTVEYRESIYVGYRFFDIAEKPLQYPFGYGLSYTTFEYSNLKLSSEKIKEDDEFSISFDIKNTGKMAGAEIAQLYVSDVESTAFRPKKELKGFKKVFLQPNETKTVSISLDSRAFSFWNTIIHDWHVESGDFLILVGASSQDIRLTGKVFVESKNPNAEIPNLREKANYYYNPSEKLEKKKRIPHEEFEAVYGAPMIENTPYQKGEFTLNNTIYHVRITPLGRMIYGLIVFGSKLVAGGTENEAMVVNAAKDTTLRSFSNFTGGLISQMSVEGLVDIMNGKKGGWKKFFAGWKKKNRTKCTFQI